jgi:peptidoglycan hydrolase-like protein with peptidoglycan-binding domain
MPDAPIVRRLTQQLRDKGYSPDDARDIATRAMQRAGNVDAAGHETLKGSRRASMGADGRAKDRAAKQSGRSPSDYVYNPKTNRAVIR